MIVNAYATKGLRTPSLGQNCTVQVLRFTAPAPFDSKETRLQAGRICKSTYMQITPPLRSESAPRSYPDRTTKRHPTALREHQAVGLAGCAAAPPPFRR